MTATKNTDLPAAKDAYSFDLHTREYLGLVRVFLSPIESKYFLPENVVDFAPPGIIPANKACRLNEARDAWQIVPDFRRLSLWSKSEAKAVPNSMQLGDTLPDAVTAQQPAIHDERAPIRNAWDAKAGAWRQEPDYSRHALYNKADGTRAQPLPPGAPLSVTLTLTPPPVGGQDFAPRWNDQGDAWEMVPDHRGLRYWLADGTACTITEIGVTPPDGYLLYNPVSEPTPVEQVAAAEESTSE